MIINLKINKNLLAVKGYYFLWNGGGFTILSFMPVYAKQLGVSSFILGVVYAALPLSGMLAKPTMGAVADKYKCQKIIFIIVQLVAAITFLSLIFLPELPTEAKIRFTCDGSKIAMETCTSNDAYASQRLKDKAFNKEILCNLKCPFDVQHWEVVCNYWEGEDYCVSHPEYLSFAAHIPTNLTDQKGNCIYFKVENVTFENGRTSYPNCSDSHQISTSCDIKCDFQEINDLATQPALKDIHVVGQYQFWLFLTVYLIAWSSQAVTTSIGDAVCFQVLGDKPHEFGYQRMWGSVGCGVLSVICGYLVDAFSESEIKKNYSPVFLTGVGTLLLCAAVSYTIQYTQQNTSTSILKDVGNLLANIRICICMLVCVCVGSCTALTWYFLFWLLEDLAADYGSDMQSNIKTIEGLVLGIQCLAGDLPFLFLSSRILKRLGHVHTMSLILLVIGVKFTLNSLLINPWWCLPIELLNGPMYGLFYATMASYASSVAPPGAEATTQGLFGAVFEGIGLAMGSLIGGLLFQEFGGSMTFRIFGIFIFIACFLHVGVQYLIQKIGKL